MNDAGVSNSAKDENTAMKTYQMLLVTYGNGISHTYAFLSSLKNMREEQVLKVINMKDVLQQAAIMK